MTQEELEKKKLELEIKKLNSPWFKNIEFWKVIIPTLAVLISLYFTFGRGLIDAEKTKLEIQKEQLKLDISRFEIKSADLTTTINSKDSAKKLLEEQLLEYTLQKRDLINRIASLNNKLGKKGQEIENIDKERSKDKKFYQDELLKEYNQEKSRLQELGSIKSQLNQRDVTIASLNAEIEFLRPMVKLTEIEKNELEIKKLSASSNQLEKQSNSYKTSIERIKEKYDKEKQRINNMSADQLIREFELNMLKFEMDEKEK